jgi:DNA-binding XRE family transcriptional regulator
MRLSSGIEAKLSLKACRINVKASATEMAKAIGVTEGTIYKWENGITSPGLIHTTRILDFFFAKGFPVGLNDINFLS